MQSNSLSDQIQSALAEPVTAASARLAAELADTTTSGRIRQVMIDRLRQLLPKVVQMFWEMGDDEHVPFVTMEFPDEFEVVLSASCDRSETNKRVNNQFNSWKRLRQRANLDERFDAFLAEQLDCTEEECVEVHELVRALVFYVDLRRETIVFDEVASIA